MEEDFGINRVEDFREAYKVYHTEATGVTLRIAMCLYRMSKNMGYEDFNRKRGRNAYKEFLDVPRQLEEIETILYRIEENIYRDLDEGDEGD